MSEELTEALDDNTRNVQFDLKSLFDHVVLEDMKITGKNEKNNNPPQETWWTVGDQRNSQILILAFF